MSPAVDGSFAEQERSSLQPLAPTLSSLVAQPLPSTLDWPPSAFSAPERADVMARISVAQQNAVATVNAFARGAQGADEAGRKAAAWGIVTTVTTAVIVAIVAVITSVFTFGSALGQVAAVLAGQVTALGVAAGNGYPLAAELAAILSAMADSLREFVRAPEQARHESTLRLCLQHRTVAHPGGAAPFSRGHDRAHGAAIVRRPSTHAAPSISSSAGVSRCSSAYHRHTWIRGRRSERSSRFAKRWPRQFAHSQPDRNRASLKRKSWPTSS